MGVEVVAVVMWSLTLPFLVDAVVRVGGMYQAWVRHQGGNE